MVNYFETGEFPLSLHSEGLRKGRSARDGYARGWGLEYGGMREEVLADPVYQEAMALAHGRTIQAEPCRMNLFLLAKYFLPKILEQSESGSIFEFGSFRGGSAIFLAAVCRRLELNVHVYGLDTFEGMPPTDKAVDAHNSGDFSGVDLAELRAYVEQCGLGNRLTFVQGIFEKTAGAQLASASPVLLAHVDCDVHASVAFAWEAVKPHMAPGGYVVFDDAHSSSCLGATEAVEDLVIRRDGLNCEQIWPHFVFRVWPSMQHGEVAAKSNADVDLRECLLAIRRLEDQLSLTARQAAGLKAQRDQYFEELEQTGRQLVATEARLETARVSLTEVEGAYDLLEHQVSMARTSRWLRLGRMLGVGPQFDVPER